MHCQLTRIVLDLVDLLANRHNLKCHKHNSQDVEELSSVYDQIVNTSATAAKQRLVLVVHVECIFRRLLLVWVLSC